MNSLKLIRQNLKMVAKLLWPELESEQQRRQRESVIQIVMLTGLN